MLKYVYLLFNKNLLIYTKEDDRMKRNLLLLAVLLAIFTSLAACSQPDNEEEKIKLIELLSLNSQLVKSA